MDIKITSDGGCLISGHFHNGTIIFSHYYIKLDSNGNTEWEERITGPTGHEGTWSSVELNDGSFVSVGGSWRDYTGNFQKLDKDGNLLWTQYLASQDSINMAFDLDLTNDNGLIICGLINGRSSDSQLGLRKTDLDGNIEWEGSYGGSGAETGFFVKSKKKWELLSCWFGILK